MARNRSFVRGAAAIRTARLTTWGGITPVASTLAANTSTILVSSLSAGALALRPFTLIRTHLEVQLVSDQAAAVETQGVSIGMAVVSDQAVAVGISAVPTPTIEADSNLWFLHQVLFADESNLTDRTKNGNYVSIDSKAMRKVEIGQDVIIVVEGAGVGGGMIVTLGGRFLLKNN